MSSLKLSNPTTGAEQRPSQAADDMSATMKDPIPSGLALFLLTTDV